MSESAEREHEREDSHGHHHPLLGRTIRFPEIERAIEQSQELMRLPEDWDDAGARQISYAVWSLASQVLRDAAGKAHRRYQYSLPVPTIGPCADGSIDLYWNTEKFTLLINVKGDQGDYYAEGSGAKVQGPFNPNSPKFDFLSLLVKP